MTQYFSELTIIFSNCTIDGSSWSDAQSDFVLTLREALLETNGIEFRGINVNNVSGDHESVTIQVMDAHYKLKQDITYEEMFDTELLMLKIVEDFPTFNCSEVRIHHTRHKSLFKGLSHPSLARIV